MENDKKSYNERLFQASALRSYFHTARFHWLVSALERFTVDTDAVFEVGCFDGKLLTYLPKQPKRYLGVDANWEKGLDIARQTYQNEANLVFLEVSSPNDINEKECIYSLAVSMETLEHVPPEQVEVYFKKISELVDGHVLFTVPNEIGIVFLMKWLSKKLKYGDAESYTFSEMINAVLGRTDRIERNEHKGFNYHNFIQLVGKHFDIESVEGIPFRWLPLCFSFGIGVVAKTGKQG